MEYPFIVLWNNQVYDSGHTLNQVLKKYLCDIDWDKSFQMIHGFKVLTAYIRESGIKIVVPLAMIHQRVTKMVMAMSMDLLAQKSLDKVKNMLEFILFAWNFLCMEYGQLPSSLQYTTRDQLASDIKDIITNDVVVCQPGRKQDHIIFNKNAMLMGLCIFQEIICSDITVDVHIKDASVVVLCHTQPLREYDMEFARLLFKAYDFSIETEKTTFVFRRHAANYLYLRSLQVAIFDPRDHICCEIDAYLRHLDISTIVCRTVEELKLHARMSKLDFVISTESVQVSGVKVIGVGVPGDYYTPLDGVQFDDIFAFLSQNVVTGPVRVGVLVRNLVIGSKLRFSLERHWRTQYIKVNKSTVKALYKDLDHLIISDEYHFLLEKELSDHQNVTFLTNNDKKFRILYPKIGNILPKMADIDISYLFE